MNRERFLIPFACIVAALVVGAAALWVAEPWKPASAPAAVAPKGALADYSWDELAAISAEVGACESETEAVRVASRYGLCDSSGRIDADAEKPVELAGGRRVGVVLVGVWHDELTSGGKAGLTFALADAAGEHAMNHAFESREGDGADSVGGWQASDMRAWLNGEFMNELPSDLRGRIASVQKFTASNVDAGDELAEAGRLAGAATDWVTETSDRLWLFSAFELCGRVDARPELGLDDTMASVYNAEGKQYRLFEDANVRAFEPNDALVRFGDDVSIVDDEPLEGADGEFATGSNSVVALPCTWWLRTKTLEFGDGFWLVGTDGIPLNGIGEDTRSTDPSYVPEEIWGPDHARGVVVGFCL